MRLFSQSVAHSILVVNVCMTLVFCDVIPMYKSATVHTFQDELQQQSMGSILKAIEGRLRNLDLVYTTKLTPTLESRLDSYQMKLDTIDARIIRLEALVMLTLDKISENISTKNFKDDIANTNMHRKMDAVYEGLSHRLNYIERKVDSNLQKTQSKIDVTLSRLEKLDNTITTKDSDIGADISDALVAIDSLKSSYSLMEEMLATTKKNTFSLSVDIQNRLVEKINGIDNKLNNLSEINSENIMNFLQSFNKTSELVVENNDILIMMKTELKDDLNNYAIKVADMGTSSGKSGDDIHKQLIGISKILNSTLSEVQNGMRAIMIQMGKIGKVTSAGICDEFVEKLDTNFEKIVANQEIFLESCHRVQMDESQIESEISTTLEKLIEMIEKKAETEARDITSVEKMIKVHDSKMYRGLSQANNNIILLHEKTSKQNDMVFGEIKRICHEIDALFVVIKDAFNSISNKKNESYINVLLNELGLIKTRLNYLQFENRPSQDIEEIKTLLNEIKYNTSNDSPKQQENILRTLYNIEGLINQSHTDFKKYDTDVITKSFEKALEKYFKKTKNEKLVVNNETESLSQEEIMKRELMITQIFGPLLTKFNASEIYFNESNPIVVETNITEPDIKCKQNILGIIDVRTGDDCDEENETTTEDNISTTSYINLIDIRADSDAIPSL